ncbi:MAG: alpha/beta hydrolase [Filomicrobium sp.]
MAKTDVVHLLPDGRRLGYCEYGAEDGVPVFALHGTPGSRFKFAVADKAAREIGLRLISPDRWGYGLTDAPPRDVSSLSHYSADLTELADALGIDKFGVVGISGGGPFAVAIAAGAPDRVQALALVAPVAPLARADERVGVSLFHRFAFRGLPRLPGAVAFVFSYFRLALKFVPPLAIRAMASRASVPDRKILARREAAEDLVSTFRAGLAKGVQGPVLDIRCFRADWELDLSSIKARARMWLGGEDRNVPVTAARRLAREIGSMELTDLPGAGHFWVVESYADVLGWLKDELQGAHHEPLASDRTNGTSVAAGDRDYEDRYKSDAHRVSA